MSVPSIYEDVNGSKLMWDIYSRQLKDRVVWIGGPINDFMANVVVAQLLYLDSQNKKDDIKLYINSPGGSVSSGLAIYDTMNYISSDVRTICVGMAASMGAFLLSAGTKGKRVILPNAEVMIHQPLGGARGQATDIAIHAEHILKTRDNLNKMLSAHTGQKLDRIKADTERDYYMNAQQAVEYGIVDHVMSKREKTNTHDDDE